jgi:hypothetical protein
LVSKCDGIGKNPFVVNVITYSGHGITFNEDAIAVIPEYEEAIKSEDQTKVLRFINLSDWARKFAKIKNTLTIFILSMCRKEVKITNIEENDEKNDEHKFLLNDSYSNNQEYRNDGYSVMLFGTQIKKPVVEGDLMIKFFDNYSQIKDLQGINIGWELINKHFHKD